MRDARNWPLNSAAACKRRTRQGAGANRCCLLVPARVVRFLARDKHIRQAWQLECGSSWPPGHPVLPPPGRHFQTLACRRLKGKRDREPRPKLTRVWGLSAHRHQAAGASQGHKSDRVARHGCRADRRSPELVLKIHGSARFRFLQHVQMAQRALRLRPTQHLFVARVAFLPTPGCGHCALQVFQANQAACA